MLPVPDCRNAQNCFRHVLSSFHSIRITVPIFSVPFLQSSHSNRGYCPLCRFANAVHAASSGKNGGQKCFPHPRSHRYNIDKQRSHRRSVLLSALECPCCGSPLSPAEWSAPQNGTTMQPVPPLRRFPETQLQNHLICPRRPMQSPECAHVRRPL